MELNEYQKKAMGTCMPSSHNYTYMAEGLVGEVGEFFSKVAKAVRKDKAIIFCNDLICGNHTDPECIADFEELKKGLKAELGDILWFVAGLAEVNGWSLEEVAWDNLLKLSDRAQRKVIDGEGDNR